MTTAQHVQGRPTIESAHVDTPGTFVFQGARALSPTEIATLRLFAAAGIRPRCVIVGSDQAPDADVFRAALRPRPIPAPAANPG